MRPNELIRVPGRLPRWAVPALLLLVAAGCQSEHVQSALHPAGPGAERIYRLWWFLFVICAAVFVAVLALLAVALVRGRRGESRPSPLGNGFIITTGILIPSAILVVILVLALDTTAAMRGPAPEVLTVRVIGHQWWWEVHYPEHGIITANEIHIPAGRPVKFELKSADVIHSFWVPNLHGKMDMLPDHWTSLGVVANRPGVYRGQCAEFCGVQHAWMAFNVVALEPDDFERWLARNRRPPAPPVTEPQRRGQAVFLQACGHCHAVRGTTADARVGPDLTHLADRLTLGAGLLPNNHGNLAGWVANPQPLKPGNKMPRSFLAPDEFHDLLAYLATLE